MIPENPTFQVVSSEIMPKSMIIVSDFRLDDKGNGVKIVVSHENVLCPECHSALSHRDWKPRIMKMDGGKVVHLSIERRRCTNRSCGRLHNVLPDTLAPYKHYASDIITGVLDEDIIPEESDVNEDRPCAETMRLWLQWFIMNLENIEGYCRRAGYTVLGMSEELFLSSASILKAIRNSVDSWLAAILRMIYNSGGRLTPLEEFRAFAPTSF